MADELFSKNYTLVSDENGNLSWCKRTVRQSSLHKQH